METAAEVLLVLARPAELLASRSRSALARMLSPADRAHVERFRFERDRDLALASRAVQRFALSMAVGWQVAADQWQFATGDKGRPYVDLPVQHRDLVFSVANTIGLVGCAVRRGFAVGLDLEPGREELPEDLLERCLSQRERDALFALASTQRAARFLRLWTAKEAYLKACGLGLIDRLDAVEVSFGPNEVPAFELDATLADDGERWTLEMFEPTLEHFGALCMERAGSPLRISRCWVPPIVAEESASLCE